MDGSYQRAVLQQIYSQQWTYGFNMAWELDFWGRFRRAIISADASLDASCSTTMTCWSRSWATWPATMSRFELTQRRIELLENVIKVQQDVYNFIDQRLKAGFRGVTDLDKAQAESDLKQSQAQVEQLRIDLRTTENGLCTLLGHPGGRTGAAAERGPKTRDPHSARLCRGGSAGRSPAAAPRRATRRATGRGTSRTDRHRHCGPLSGVLRLPARSAGKMRSSSNLIEPGSFIGSVGPSFQWNVLNYGRLLNNIRLQDAHVQRAGGQLSKHGRAGQRRSGKRHRHVSAAQRRAGC